MQPISQRYDLELLFDVADGNPNGDPDAENLPRTDPVTGHGLVTDIAIKRKLRDLVAELRPGAAGFDLFVRSGEVLNNAIERGYDQGQLLLDALKSGELPAALAEDARARRALAATAAERAAGAPITAEVAARAWMSANFFDVRAFGAVMSTGDAQEESEEEAEPGPKVRGKAQQKGRPLRKTAGRLTGPVQFTLARSIDPVQVQSHRLTRQVATNAKDAGKEQTMGVKHTVPYALYRMHGFISAPQARRTGFDESDLGVLLEALGHLFVLDRAAARGLMTLRRLVVWRHDSALGNAPAHRLFERLRVERTADIPRGFGDYRVELDASALPAGVALHLDLEP